MMDRDKRLTGHFRGQRVRLSGPVYRFPNLIAPTCQTDPIAPEGFDTSSVWYTERAS